jgi:hypothetical protein
MAAMPEASQFFMRLGDFQLGLSSMKRAENGVSSRTHCGAGAQSIFVNTGQ